MVQFNFDALGHDPWRDAKVEEPEDYALRLWLQYQSAEHDMDLKAALELAPHDLEVWTALLEGVQHEDVSSWSVVAQAALGRALASRPPRAGVGETARRNKRMIAVAQALVREYKIQLTRGETSAAKSASSVIKTLPGLEMLSDRSIVNILTKRRAQN